MTKYTAEPWDLMPHGIIHGGPVQQYANGSTWSQIAMATGAEFTRHPRHAAISFRSGL